MKVVQFFSRRILVYLVPSKVLEKYYFDFDVNFCCSHSGVNYAVLCRWNRIPTVNFLCFQSHFWGRFHRGGNENNHFWPVTLRVKEFFKTS
jgi:hypothetical protein